MMNRKFYAIFLMMWLGAAHLCAGFDKNPDLLFMENRGQIVKADQDVLFAARAGNVQVCLLPNGISYRFDGQVKNGEVSVNGSRRIDVTFANANPHPAIRREKASMYTEHYYLPHCPDGIVGVPGYEQLVYEDIYPHIDWVVYSNGKGMKYDFVVKPGGDAKHIRLTVAHATETQITESGVLVMTNGTDEVREQAPECFMNGQKVPSGFKLNKDGAIGFDVKNPRQGETLVIDPVVEWATYYGGSKSDAGSLVTTDDSGHVYMIGTTESTNNIAYNGAQSTLIGDNDIFLVKFNTKGQRIWGTYYHHDEGIIPGMVYYFYPTASTVDRAGNIYLVMNVDYTDGSLGYSDTSIVVKFSNTGQKVWSKRIGDIHTSLISCTIDQNGNLFVAGSTNSSSNISLNGHQNLPGGKTDGFLIKMDPNGQKLWGTYYGGSENDQVNACAVDGNGNVFVAGTTESSNNIAHNGHLNLQPGGSRAFLVKFSSTGQRIWGTYYGDYYATWGYGCASDKDGNIYLSGQVGGGPPGLGDIAYNGYQNIKGGQLDDLFLVKFNPTGQRLWGTFYGGDNVELRGGCFTDDNGNVYLSGSSASQDVLYYHSPSWWHSKNTRWFLRKSSGQSPFLTKFNNTGQRLWSTCTLSDVLAVDKKGSICMITVPPLDTINIAFNGHQNMPGGNGDAFLLKINDIDISVSSVSSSQLCPGSSFQIDYRVTGTYNDGLFHSGNTFTAVLSDASGSFATTFPLGSVNATGSGSIACTVPSGLATGLGLNYAIRVRSSSLPTISYDSIPVTILSGTPPSVLITANPGNVICSGTTVTFTATPANATGTLTYQWKKNGVNTGSNSSVYTDNALADNDVISCELVASGGCQGIVSSNTITMSVSNTLAPAVNIVASPGQQVSTGQSVMFAATAANGGNAPQYEWLRNTTPLTSASGNIYTGIAGTDFNDGDEISVRLTSNAVCVQPQEVQSNKIKMSVHPVSVSEIPAMVSEVIIYPNPNDGRFTLQAANLSAGNCLIEVTDLVGRVLYRNTWATKSPAADRTVTLEPHPAPGVYLLKLYADGKPVSVSRFSVK